MQTAEDADVAPEPEATAAGLTMWHATHSHAVAITINFVASTSGTAFFFRNLLLANCTSSWPEGWP